MSIDTLLASIGVLAGVALGIFGLLHIEMLLSRKQKIEKDRVAAPSGPDTNSGD